MKKLAGLNARITGLDGEAAPTGGTPEEPTYETVGRMLANVLARGQSEDAVKAMMLAMEIYGAKTLELEDADFNLVQAAVDSDTALTNLGKAALLNVLNDAKTVPVKGSGQPNRDQRRRKARAKEKDAT